MKFLTSIRTKVWMTVLIVFTGYLVSTLSSFSLNVKLSEHLTHLRGYDFFLAMKSTKAQNAFKEQTGLYEDAYLTGSRESALKGNAMAADISAILDEMIETVNSCSHGDHTTPFMGLFIRHNADRLLDLRQRYRAFSAEAATVYLRASRNNEDTPALRNAIHRLGKAKSVLHRDFAETEVLYVSSFERGIDRMKSAARRETYFLPSLFVAVLIASAAITNFVATRLLIKPLRRVHDMVASFAKGSIEPPSLLPSDRRDEIGELEGAFYQMTVDLKSTTVSKHYVDNVIKSMTDSLVVVTTKGTIKTVNETTLDILGYAAGEIAGRPFSMIFEESDDEAVVFRNSGVRTLLRQALIRNIEKRFRTRDGRTIPVLVSLAAITAEDGSFQGLVCVARDITERKRAEEAIRQSERDLKNIMNSIRAGIIVIDPSDHVIVDANAYALTMIGAEKDAVVGKDCRALLCPASDACPITDLHAPADNAERLLVTASGESIPILKSAVPVLYRGRQHLIESFIDISPLKQAESKLQMLAVKLGHSNDELKEINEELKNFAYIVSHDLRAPLVNIRGFSTELGAAVGEIKSFLATSLTQASPEDRTRIETIMVQDVQEALGFISSSVSRMDALITAILNLSRLGRRVLSPEPVDVTALVHGILKTLAHQLEERSARVTVGTLPAVEADKTALGTIFGNLLDNAVKYLDRTRPGKIDVSAERRNGEFLFRISDNGRGIAEGDLHKVFDLFCRSGTPDVPGEGMGLAYVRTLVRRHGGRIWCESTLGEGTTFCFTISTPRA